VADMFSASLSNSSGLVVRYDFSADNIKKGTPGANGIARVIVPIISCVWLLGHWCIALQQLVFGGHGTSCYLISCLHISDCAWDQPKACQQHYRTSTKTFCIFDVGILADLQSAFTQSSPHTHQPRLDHFGHESFSCCNAQTYAPLFASICAGTAVGQ